MVKIIVSESQIRRLAEEIDKNDTIQKLISADSSSIDFEAEETMGGISKRHHLYQIYPIIDGKRITTEYVSLLGEPINLDGDDWYQLHIRVNENIRRYGIAYKLYTAFIEQGYPICSLFSNRAGNFYKQQGVGQESDNAIDNLWNKIKNTPGVKTDDIVRDGRVIGIKAYKS